MSNELRLWLEQIGLAQHAEAFAANDIDLDVLPELSDEDLKELGLSLGPQRVWKDKLVTELELSNVA